MENNNKEPKTLHRSSTNRIVFGVCGGLGEYFDVDPILFRIVFILLIFGAGSGVIIYLLLALLMPKDVSSVTVENKIDPTVDVKNRIHELAAELKSLKRSNKGQRRGVVRLLLGLIILVIGLGILSQDLNLFPGFYFNMSLFFRYFWPILVILIGLSILSKEVY
jgi:phage shock protein C